MALGLLYITFEKKEDAVEVTKKLLSEKLIACGNIFTIDSIYRWEGKLVDGDEYVLLLKTEKGRVEDVKKRVLEEHPYEVPCVIELEAGANDSYERWLSSEVD